MKSLYHIYEILFYFSVLILIGAGQDAEQNASKESDLYCEHYKGHYGKPYGTVCCQNETFYNPFQYYGHLNLSVCSGELSRVDSDDLPTAMWREHLCVLKATEVKEESLTTFKGFMEYMASNYSEPQKSQILESLEKCNEAETEKDEPKRLKMFYLCMYKSERKVCHQPYGNLSDLIVKSAAKKQKYCQPDENFPNFGSQCCKGGPIPFPQDVYTSFLSPYVIEDISGIKKCMQTYIDRQKALSPKGKLVKCQAACQLSGIPFTSREALKIDIEKVKKLLFPLFSPTLKNELLIRLDKYREMKIYKNSTYSFSELVQRMPMVENEFIQINWYCNLYEYIVIDLELSAIDDYCYDESYAKNLLKEIQQQIMSEETEKENTS